MHVRREVLQQERHAVAEVGPVDQVVVIEHQNHIIRRGRELVEHRDDDGLDRRLGRLQQRERVGSNTRDRRLQGGDHVGPERGGLAVALIEGQPRHRPFLRGRRGKPCGEQSGLSEPGGAEISVSLASAAWLKRPPNRGRATILRRSLGMNSLVSTKGLANAAPLVGSRGGDAHEGRACNRTTRAFRCASTRCKAADWRSGIGHRSMSGLFHRTRFTGRMAVPPMMAQVPATAYSTL